MYEPIKHTDSFQDTIVKMAEGNPGALSVLMRLLTHGDNGPAYILHLDDMNLRGSTIWVAYKDHCGEDLDKLVECIKDRDPDMISTVNTAIDRGDCGKVPPVVEHGASFAR